MNLLNTSGDNVEYLKDLIDRVLKEGQDYKKLHGSPSNSVTVKLHHTWDIDAVPKYSHKLIYSIMTRTDGKINVETEETILEDGVNYSNDIINELIKGVIEQTNQDVSNSIKFGYVPPADEIKPIARGHFKAALKSIGIYWDVNMNLVVVGTQIVNFSVIIG
ncbi:hypothetical protein D5W64_12430 [Salmonella enterica subsp. enterica serovar Saintpaul]|nr:hypothetical protein [Salmonella enterica subsp. enterica serovar Saintpaul]